MKGRNCASNGRSSLVVSLLLAVAVTLQAGQNGDDVVRVVFQMDTDIVVGQPLLVLLTIDNRLAEPIEIDLGRNREGNIHVEARDPNGSSLVTTGPSLPPAGGISQGGLVSVAARQVYTQQFVLDEWVRLTAPGEYKVAVGLASPVRTRSGRIVAAPAAQRLDVRVSAADDARLREACQQLAQRTMYGATYEIRAKAALALSQVSAPVAVDAIAMVIDATDEADRFMTAGLERIGTTSARSVLARMAASPRSDRAERAMAALERFRLRP